MADADKAANDGWEEFGTDEDGNSQEVDTTTWDDKEDNDEEWGTEKTEEEEAEDEWWNNFQATPTTGEDADDAADSMNEFADDGIDAATTSLDGLGDSATDSLASATGCVDLIDNFSVGKLGGKVFAKLFNNEVKPI